jgi:hypothetical protein
VRGNDNVLYERKAGLPEGLFIFGKRITLFDANVLAKVETRRSAEGLGLNIVN